MTKTAKLMIAAIIIFVLVASTILVRYIRQTDIHGAVRSGDTAAVRAMLTARPELIAITKETIKKDGKLPLAGLGTFVLVNRKARTGRNPQTGQPIQIKASKAVRFRPGKDLKDSI